MNFFGTAGNDTIIGTSADDVFDMSQGGDDTVSGGAGNDTFKFGATFTASDSIDGGAGNDTLSLAGDYSAGVTFTSTMVTSVETILIGADHNYLVQDFYLGAGLTMTVNGAALSSGNWLNFESPNSDGRFGVIGGAGNDIIDTGNADDVILGGAGSDSIQPGSGANTVQGGDGNDFITFFTPLSVFAANDSLDGGNGSDVVTITGNYSTPITFTATTIVNVESLSLMGGNFNFTTNDANVAAAQSLTVDGSLLTSTQTLAFNGAAETNGAFLITGGAGADRLIGGASNDHFTGGGGADRMQGGTGSDTFIYNGVSDSMSSVYDHISDFNTAIDRIDLPGAVTGIDAAITSGTLNSGTFDTNLAAAVGSGQLAAGHAVLFTVTAGDLHGHEFLVVDANGIAGYQASQDYVIEIGGITGALTTGDFI